MFDPKFFNRDSDTHLHIVDDLHYSREDLRPERELAQWEKDYVNYHLLEEELKED